MTTQVINTVNPISHARKTNRRLFFVWSERTGTDEGIQDEPGPKRAGILPWSALEELRQAFAGSPGLADRGRRRESGLGRALVGRPRTYPDLGGTGEMEMQTKPRQEKPRPSVLAGVGVVWAQLK
jgi:hypothetical protein